MRNIVAAIVILIVIVGGAILIFRHNGGYKTPSTNSSSGSSMSSMSSNSQNSNSAPTATNSVTIQNFAFSPASITVKKGTAVTWTNNDSTTHTVTESDGQTGPDSGDLPTGKSYSFTFNTAGTFKYHCSIHPGMTGTVTVTE